jgi:hypothetical protein
LIKQQTHSKDYGIIHFDSPDKEELMLCFTNANISVRPIPIFRCMFIKEMQVEASLVIEAADKSDDVLEINYQNNRVFTRDQLLVTGFLDGEEINIIVNHWPSRSGGKKSSPFREAAASLNQKLLTPCNA